MGSDCLASRSERGGTELLPENRRRVPPSFIFAGCQAASRAFPRPCAPKTRNSIPAPGRVGRNLRENHHLLEMPRREEEEECMVILPARARRQLEFPTPRHPLDGITFVRITTCRRCPVVKRKKSARSSYRRGSTKFPPSPRMQCYTPSASLARQCLVRRAGRVWHDEMSESTCCSGRAESRVGPWS